MARTISIGVQDFAELRENHYFYVDKTGFIKEWWENGDSVTLITRPRCFGKTLNMSMVEQFFSVRYAGREDLFEGLEIWEDENCRSLQGKWPVIFLSFAGIKGSTYSDVREGIIQLLVKLYGKHQYLRASGILTPQENEYFDSVHLKMSDMTAAFAIHSLSDYMSRYYGKKVIILLDEYDTPLQEAYVNGFWEELTAFIRSLFNNTFKTNPYMQRGLLTGITWVGKESIFSDMNHLVAVTTTSKQYALRFGFTEEEVFQSLDTYGLSGQKEEVRAWYDGFAFGGYRDIYNPWSVISFLKEKKLKAYWANTSANALVGKLIREGSSDIKIAMEDLLAGEQISTPIDEEIIFNQLDSHVTAIWSLLLASGYLKVDREPDYREGDTYLLSLINYEVKKMFQNMINGWFKNSLTRYGDFVKALLSGDLEYMNDYMNQIAAQTFSYFDVGGGEGHSEPERFYHGFVLGLIVDLSSDYRITSNRESGLGRYDVVLEPRKADLPAFVLEFKVRRRSEKSLEETVESALAQIEEKEYDAELTANGIADNRIRHYGFAFEGKRVLIGGSSQTK